MSYSALVSLGTVGAGITSVKLYECDNGCSNCSALTNYLNVPVSSFNPTLIITGITSGKTSIKAEPIGACSGVTQCIAIIGIPTPTPTASSTPTPTPTSTSLPGATSTPTPTSTPSPTNTSTPTATDGPGATSTPTPTPTDTLYYLQLQMCGTSVPPGTSTGWTINSYTTSQCTYGDIFYSAGGYYYVVINSSQTDQGGTIDGSKNTQGYYSCADTPQGQYVAPTNRTAGLSFFAPTGSTSYQTTLTNTCGKDPSQFIGGSYGYGYTTSTGGWINGSPIVPGTIYQLYQNQSQSDGTTVVGPNKYCPILISGSGSTVQYVCYVNSSGEISEWYDCTTGQLVNNGPSATSTPTPTATSTNYYAITTLYSGSTGTDVDSGSACWQINVNLQSSNVQTIYTTTGYLVDGGYAYQDALGPAGAGLFNGLMHYYSDGINYGRIGYTGLITVVGSCSV